MIKFISILIFSLSFLIIFENAFAYPLRPHSTHPFHHYHDPNCNHDHGSFLKEKETPSTKEKKEKEKTSDDEDSKESEDSK